MCMYSITFEQQQIHCSSVTVCKSVLARARSEEQSFIVVYVESKEREYTFFFVLRVMHVRARYCCVNTFVYSNLFLSRRRVQSPRKRKV